MSYESICININILTIDVYITTTMVDTTITLHIGKPVAVQKMEEITYMSYE